MLNSGYPRVGALLNIKSYLYMLDKPQIGDLIRILEVPFWESHSVYRPRTDPEDKFTSMKGLTFEIRDVYHNSILVKSHAGLIEIPTEYFEIVYQS